MWFASMKRIYLEEVDSTNLYAKRNIDKIKDKTIIYTSRQTAGRGRMERKWNYMGDGNIYASIVLKPSKELKEVYSNLTQYLCVILAETFENFGIIPQIKWPNDIRINYKKISGILAEAVCDSDGLKGLIIGFGVNLNCKKDEIEMINQPATSLNLELGFEINKEKFLKKLLEKFCLRYDEFIEKGFLLIREEYIRRVEFLNQPVTVRVFDKEIQGIAKDITESGAIKLLDNNDIEHTLLIGDIL